MSRERRRGSTSGAIGRVVETRGRRVLVRDPEGERVCFLSGHRAVVGDEVRWVPAPGEGGKIVAVLPRRTVLRRVDFSGREQILAANLGGLLAVAAAQQPPFRAGLLDRYVVAARSAGLEVALCLNKVDLGVPEDVERELALRATTGLEVLRVSARTGEGLDALRAFLAERSAAGGPWALVGHSGVGKTSVIGALLPGQDVGDIGEISEHWGTGQHTTTRSRIFAIDGGEVVDSPGIRTFAPGGLQARDVREHFPGMHGLDCRYRDCLHREDEEGCVAEDSVNPDLLASYRRLLHELLDIEDRRRPR